MAAISTQPGGHSAEANRLRDFRQEVTDNIVRMLESGVAPWQRPWDSTGVEVNMPMNPTSGRAYRGGNALHLVTTALQNGYHDPRWMTYKQAADQKWQVRRGEKGTQIEFWDVSPERHGNRRGSGEATKDADAITKRDRLRLIHRVYTVFNGAQIDGIPAHAPRQRAPFEIAQSGERILTASGAKIALDQANAAFYDRIGDAIHLPPKEAFRDAPGYYGTALHELAHWSGHPSRLNRLTLTESYRFGDVNYAKEELRAELASVFLAAERGIPHDPQRHAAYVGSWIKALKEDKNEIFRAAHDAAAATDFLLSLERERSRAEEELATAQELTAATEFTPGGVLEGEAAEIHRDRERLEELDLGAELGDVAASETAEHQKPDPFAEERAIAIEVLGGSANLRAARMEGGTYRGAILGETQAYVIQRESGQSAVAHPKEALDRQPLIGEVVRISYSNCRGQVREAHEKAKSHELAR